MRAGCRLLPLTIGYAAFAVATVPLSIFYDVGASPEGSPSDVVLKGSGYTPPLFLPVLLVIGALLARRSHRRSAIAGAALDTLIGLAILGGSTLNVPNDLAAVEAAEAPSWITYALAGVSAVFSLAIVGHGAATIVARLWGRRVEAEAGLRRPA
jgi:hypothetical protein